MVGVAGAQNPSVDSRTMRRSAAHHDDSANPAPRSALAPTAAVPASGETRLRVRYCECDPMGVAHHSACVPWLEIGRTDLLRACGVTYAQLEASGIFLVITRLDVRYKSPARYDDELILVTRVAGGTRVRIDHDYELWRDGGPERGKTELLITAATTLACVDETGRPQVMPDWLTPTSRAPRRE